MGDRRYVGVIQPGIHLRMVGDFIIAFASYKTFGSKSRRCVIDLTRRWSSIIDCGPTPCGANHFGSFVQLST